MAIKCRYRVRGHLAFVTEAKLVNKYGFRIHSRKPGEWVIIEREVRKEKGLPAVDDIPEHPENHIPWDRQGELIRRCCAITDFFIDPQAHLKTIQIRTNNFAQTLPPIEKAFVQQWMDRNLEKVY